MSTRVCFPRYSDKKHHQEQLRKEKLYLILQLKGNKPSLREARAGTKGGNLGAELTEKTAYSLHGLLSHLSQDHLPRSGRENSGLGSLTSISNQENALQIFTQASVIKAIPKFRLPLPI